MSVDKASLQAERHAGAAAVYEAVKDLNTAMRMASVLGLEVRIEQDKYHQVGASLGYPYLIAKVSLEL